MEKGSTVQAQCCNWLTGSMLALLSPSASSALQQVQLCEPPSIWLPDFLPESCRLQQCPWHQGPFLQCTVVHCKKPLLLADQ